MSDYVHNKAIMFPINDTRFVDIIDDRLDTKFQEISSFYNETGFEIELFDDGESLNYYLSYVLFHTYGEESGDFGTSRSLTKDEEVYWTERFSIIWKDVFDGDINPSWLRFVDYCYYNACEPEDYYKMCEIQENTIELDKSNVEKFKKFLEN